ncbi:DUF3339 domain-containing protein [Cinnamomum micranthum f. kanehirae]|uniref:DUF3339 domain-containing protein n=1 Tax=Cinnamomum micranthum f. kanehirae TaxID=337451 RepID=A0A443P8I6_9MAGN|nr:DUF3339 domain-containing protein [Cinnamomum micranthum f. kanehirae]
MADWAPIVIGLLLFILLSPGLLFQLPGNTRRVEFGGLQTNGKAIAIHTLIFFIIFTILILAVGFHIYAERDREMADWGPVVIAVVLFVLLTPGLLFQLPGKSKVVEFNNFQTSGLSILVHTIIFFGLITIFLIAIGVHIYTG